MDYVYGHIINCTCVAMLVVSLRDRTSVMSETWSRTAFWNRLRAYMRRCHSIKYFVKCSFSIPRTMSLEVFPRMTPTKLHSQLHSNNTWFGYLAHWYRCVRGKKIGFRIYIKPTKECQRSSHSLQHPFKCQNSYWILHQSIPSQSQV